MALFSRIHKETGVTILMVTHARQLVIRSRHVEMKAGAMHEDDQ